MSIDTNEPDTVANDIYNDGIDALAWGDNEMDNAIPEDSLPVNDDYDAPDTPAAAVPDDTEVDLSSIISVQLSRERFGTTKSFNDAEKAGVASQFHGRSDGFGGNKKIIPKDDPTLKKINSVMSQVYSQWKALSQPYPFLDGVRLTCDQNLPIIQQAVQEAQESLQHHEQEMTARREEIMAASQVNLGDAYDATMYPPSFEGSWSVELSHPSIKPDDRLKQLNPELYEAEVQKVLAQVKSSADMYMDQMVSMFDDMATQMLERLTPGADGKLKVIKNTSFKRWQECFDQFESVTSVMSGTKKAHVNEVIAKAKAALDGVTAEKLKKDTLATADLKAKFAEIKSQLGGMIETVERHIDLDD